MSNGPSVQAIWNADYTPDKVTGKDCEWAAWLYKMYGRKNTFLFWDTVRDLMLAGFCLIFAVGCAEHPLRTMSSDLSTMRTALENANETIVTKQDESIGILKENTTALAAIKSQIDTLKAVQAESETGNGNECDLSSDPPPNAETVVNDSHASSPGMQSVKASAVDLFVCSTASCAPCKRLWRDVDDGKLDGFVLTKVAPFDGMKSYPAIRFADSDSDTGWSVVYGYDEQTRLWLRSKLLGEKDPLSSCVAMDNTPPVPLLRTVMSSRNDAHFGGSLSHGEMKALHDRLHGGGSWTWPGDLATHLATTHGVSTGGAPLTGAFFPIQGQAAITNSRSTVRSVSPGQRFVGRARVTSGKSCPSGRCP